MRPHCHTVVPVPDPQTRFDELAANPLAVRWEMSASGAITSISDSVLEARGFTPEQASTQGIDEIHPPESMRASLAYFEHFSHALLEGRVPEAFEGELEYWRADGSAALFEVVALPVIDDAGEVTGLRGVSAPVADHG